MEPGPAQAVAQKSASPPGPAHDPAREALGLALDRIGESTNAAELLWTNGYLRIAFLLLVTALRESRDATRSYVTDAGRGGAVEDVLTGRDRFRTRAVDAWRQLDEVVLPVSTEDVDAACTKQFFELLRGARAIVKLLRPEALGPRGVRRRRIVLTASISFTASLVIGAVLVAAFVRPDLPPEMYGGQRGAARILRCPDGVPMTGVDVYITRNVVAGLALSCGASEGSPDVPSPGDTKRPPIRRGAGATDGGTPDAAVPARPRARDGGPRVQPSQKQQRPPRRGPIDSAVLAGRSIGAAEELRCPDGLEVIGIFGAYGSLIDRLGLICGESQPRRARVEYVQPVGGPGGGQRFHSTCPEGERAAGLRVRSATFIDAVGLACEPMTF